MRLVFCLRWIILTEIGHGGSRDGKRGLILFWPCVIPDELGHCRSGDQNETWICTHGPCPSSRLCFNPLLSGRHERFKECFLIGRNRTKRANFRGSPFFRATYILNTEKQTINSNYLVSVRCSEASGRKTSNQLCFNFFPPLQSVQIVVTEKEDA